MQLAFNLSIKFGIIGKTIGIQILPTAWKALTLVKVVIALSSAKWNENLVWDTGSE